MPAIHLFFGLSPVLVPIGYHSNILLGILLSSIRITWPSQAILLLFINTYFTHYNLNSNKLRFTVRTYFLWDIVCKYLMCVTRHDATTPTIWRRECTKSCTERLWFICPFSSTNQNKNAIVRYQYILLWPAFEDGTDRVFRNVGY
jgi:hypothetical protein